MLGSDTNEINAWWWRGRHINNFGDELGAKILKKMGYRVNRVALKDADIVLGGTTIDIMESKAKDGCIIWGGGVGWEHEVQNRFDVRAVRGKLSAKCLGFDGAIGDIGLLVSKYWAKQPYKYNVGVVRHYVDKNEYEWADIVIDTTERVDTVIEKISQCRTILSSSLHGVIVAQSFGIPAMRIYDENIIGGNTKWIDYASALGKSIDVIQEELVNALWTS